MSIFEYSLIMLHITPFLNVKLMSYRRRIAEFIYFKYRYKIGFKASTPCTFVFSPK